MLEELLPSPRCSAIQRTSEGEVLQMKRAQVKLYGVITRQERPETVGGAAIKGDVKFPSGKAPAGSFGLHVQFGQKRVMRGEKRGRKHSVHARCSIDGHKGCAARLAYCSASIATEKGLKPEAPRARVRRNGPGDWPIRAHFSARQA